MTKTTQNRHKHKTTSTANVVKMKKASVLDLLVPGLASDTSTSGPVAWDSDW